MARLWNWSAWARTDLGGPDGSCVNSIWDNWNPYGSGRETGWGDPDGAPDGDGIDEADAEAIDCWVRQLPAEPRAILVRRFVLRQRIGWETVDPAVRALSDLMDANRAAVGEMHGRGW